VLVVPLLHLDAAVAAPPPRCTRGWITGANPDAAGTNPIDDQHLVSGFNGLNQLMNDLTVIPVGRTVIHVSGMVLLLAAVSVWAVNAWRREARYQHEVAGTRALGQVGALALAMCGLTLAWALVPVSTMGVITPIARSIGLGCAN
jgi:hypothetical protein